MSEFSVRRPRVIHTAQALVDWVVQVPRVPRRGGNVMAPPGQAYAGGAVNILLAAARSGATAVHAGSIGTGPNGDLIRGALDAEGVTYPAPPVPSLDTALCVVMVEPTAERTFITTMAAERVISVASLNTSQPLPDDLICISGYSLLDPTRDPLMAWMETLPDGVQIVLDPGAVFASIPHRPAVLAMTNVWTSNAQEAKDLTRVSDPAESPAAVAKRMRKAGAVDPVVIVRDGAKGCWVWEEDVTTYVPGFPQVPVDTNGAGDAHTGALVAKRASGASWVESARWANAVAAIKVTRRGPATAPTAEETESFLKAQR